MKLISRDQGALVLSLSRDELVAINNALNEVCHGVGMPGFESRIGASRDEVEGLLASVSRALDEAAG